MDDVEPMQRPNEDPAEPMSLVEEARKVVENVDWQMDNFVPAKGETEKQCRDRRLVTAIAGALADRTAELNDIMIALVGRGTPDESTRVRVRRRIIDQMTAGNDGIELDAKEWATIIALLSTGHPVEQG